MPTTKFVSFKVVSRIALFTAIAATVFIFTAAGASASGYTFLDPVKEYLGLANAGRTAVVTPKASSVEPAVENPDKTGARLKENEAAPGKMAGATQTQLAAKSDRTDGKQAKQESRIIVGQSYHNDTSPPLRDMVQLPITPHLADDETAREANKNPSIPGTHIDEEDNIVQSFLAPDVMPTPIRNMDGIGFPGVSCNCAPPDTDGDVGATQYVQMVNNGYQVFNKSTGASVLGPSSVVSLWAGFGGVCQTNG
ncbi:MAG: hypothetical protein ABI539_14170, partial [Acidobacteriota bacterium]